MGSRRTGIVPNEVLDRMRMLRLVPVVVIDDVRHAAPLADALVSGGLPVAEVTFRTAAAIAAIETMADRGDMLVGAGTVLTPDQVDVAVDAGASYIVSPGLDAGVVRRCRERGVLPLPGAVTATEVQAALAMGIDAVKFFPAEPAGGTRVIRSLAGPFHDLWFVPTGGIGPDNLAEYASVPTVLAVGGSWMVPRKTVAAADFEHVSVLTAEAVALATG